MTCFTCEVLINRIAVYTKTGNQHLLQEARVEYDQHLFDCHKIAAQWGDGSVWIERENDGLPTVPTKQNHRS